MHGNSAHREYMIREAAYFRAERRQFSPGKAHEDWAAAEHEIDTALRAREQLIAGMTDSNGVKDKIVGASGGNSMSYERRTNLKRGRKQRPEAERRIPDVSIFQPNTTGKNQKPTTTLAHAAAATRSSQRLTREKLQGRQVTESTQAPAMAAALEAELKREEGPKDK